MPKIGAVLSMPGSGYAELLARHLDFVWIDLEHSALSSADMQDALIGIAAAGAAAYVRVPRGASPTVALDAGADGIVFPRVRSIDDAERAVASLRLPPEGIRAYGPRRPSAFPLASRPACILQIQDLAGVHAAADIASIPGVDQLVVGASDLSFALGEPLDVDTPPMRAALAAVRHACAGTATSFGIVGLPPIDALQAGADVVFAGVDVRLIDEALAQSVESVLHAGHG